MLAVSQVKAPKPISFEPRAVQRSGIDMHGVQQDIGHLLESPAAPWSVILACLLAVQGDCHSPRRRIGGGDLHNQGRSAFSHPANGHLSVLAVQPSQTQRGFHRKPQPLVEVFGSMHRLSYRTYRVYLASAHPLQSGGLPVCLSHRRAVHTG